MTTALQSDDQPDGRSARSIRTRAAVVSALLDLIREGTLRPTAREIADRAGISLRSVYVHFEDLEDLFMAAAREHQQELFARWLRVDPGLPYPERRARYVRQRAELLEYTTPIARAAALHETDSVAIAEVLEVGSTLTARELTEVFAAEIEALPPDRRAWVGEALAGLVWVETWHYLRVRRGLDVAGASAVLAGSIDALLASEPLPGTEPPMSTDPTPRTDA